MNLLIRPARSTDAGKLGAMISEAVAANTWKPALHTGAEDIAHMGDLITRGWARVAESEDRVVGFLALDAPMIQSLYVAGSCQGGGIGTALLKDAMRGQDRLELWTLEANAGAQRFYCRHGFAEAERTDGAGNEEGLPDIRFVWDAPKEESENG